MIRAAEVFHRASHHAFAGIRAKLERPDFGAIVKQKDELVAELQQAKYWDVLAAYPSVMLVKGRANFRDDGTLLVDGKPLRARKVILAMGSGPWAPPIPGLDSTPYLTSTEARDTRGLIKLIADEKTNLLVGAHILAPEAGEMVQAAAMAIRFGIRVEEIAAMLHPYLTHAEGLTLACQTFKKDVAKLSCCAA